MATNIKSFLIIACNFSYLAVLPFILIAFPAQGQGPSTKTVDVAQLKLKFKEAFSHDFEIVGDEVRKKGEEEFWLVTVRAKKAGVFVFRYKFQRLQTGYFSVKDNTYHVYSDKEAVKDGYHYYDNEYQIFVGEKGCKRSLYYYNAFSLPLQPSICAGDAVIIPIRIDKGFMKHSFSNVSRFEIEIPPHEIDDKALDTQPVENLAAAHLKYIGQAEQISVPQSDGYRVEFSAIFEATRPGKFNLQLSAQVLDKTKQDNKTNASLTRETPIIVVPKDNPITILASHVRTEKTEDGFEGSSSLGSNNYPVKTLILRPGDRVSVEYLILGVFRKAEDHKSLQVKPIIEKESFSNVQVDDRYWYDDWLSQPTVP